MNYGGFSWRRLLGISAFKSRVSRMIGIPLTASGRRRKLGASVFNVIGSVFGTLAVAAVAGAKQRGNSNEGATFSEPPSRWGVRCMACGALALYRDPEAAKAAASKYPAMRENYLVHDGERIRLAGFGKFEHQCRDKWQKA